MTKSESEIFVPAATQYSLVKILEIWALSAIPMGLLAWVVTPALIPHFNLPVGILYWFMMMVGLGWQGILSLFIVHREEGNIRWSTIRRRMWFNRPRDPKTGAFHNILFLWIGPFILLRLALLELPLPSVLSTMFPFLEKLPRYNMQDLATPEYKGAWWLLGLMLVHIPLNYFFGEEFLFRGILLPKMKGVFGKWDWFANGVLFGFYHLHRPEAILSSVLVSGVIFSYPSKRFQCNWMAVIIHGIEGVFFLFVVMGIILG